MNQNISYSNSVSFLKFISLITDNALAKNNVDSTLRVIKCLMSIFRVGYKKSQKQIFTPKINPAQSNKNV
jgi:hypothetical protein